jgi:hypothetical protein
MKMESFFIGPLDEDIIVQITLSLKEIKFIHGTLVDCFDEQPPGKVSSALTDSILFLEHKIKETLLEKERNG